MRLPESAVAAEVLTLPGLWSSGPGHWQTLWEARHASWRRVAQRDWEAPRRRDWIDALTRAIAACAQPPVLAAHSLGCALVAHWAAAADPAAIRGAMLVAPADVDAPSCPEATADFRPMPMQRLPFPSLVVASENDPYVSAERARSVAAAWGSELVMIGRAGHINGDAGYGPWPEGERMLREFVARIAC